MMRHRNAWILSLGLLASKPAFARQEALPVVESPSSAGALSPPSEGEIWKLIPAAKADAKVERKNARFEIEKIGEKVDAPRDYPLVGRCCVVHCHYKCTASFDEVTRSDDPVPVHQSQHRVEVVFLNKDFLQRCEKPASDDLEQRVKKLEQRVEQLLDRGASKAVPPEAPAYAAPAVETPRTVKADVFRGRVVGPDGRPVAGAKVTPLRLDDKAATVLTRADGRFEVEPIDDENAPAVMTGQALKVEAAGLARQMFVPSSGGDTIRLQEGAPVCGRVLYKGQPVEDVEVCLVASDRIMPVFLGEWKAETDRHGRFAFQDIPKGHEFDLYFSIASLRNFGAITPRHVKVGPRSLQVDVSEIEVGPSHKVAGVLKFSDGRAVPPGTVAHVSIEGGWGSQRCPVDEQGRFAVDGLPTTTAQVLFVFDNRTYEPKGYRLSPKNRSYDPGYGYLFGKLDRDITDLIVLYEPGEPSPRNGERPGMDEEDVRELYARPLHGIEPGDRK